MDIFIDTANDDLYIGVFWNGILSPYKIHIKNLQKKQEKLISEFRSMLASDTTLIDAIKNYYIIVGPGSFTGSRQALAFFSTFARVLGKNVWVGSTFDVLSTINDSSELYINAAGNKSFVWTKNNNKIIVTENENLPEGFEYSKIDYELLEQNFIKITDKFRLADETEIIEPLYVKNPQIGVRK